MMNTRTVEIWVGVFVAAGIAALFMLAMKVSNLSAYTDDDGYEITARFDDASGLKVRSPVTMAGVTLGRVTDIRFDTNGYQAVVTMQIDSSYNTCPMAPLPTFILRACWVKSMLACYPVLQQIHAKKKSWRLSSRVVHLNWKEWNVNRVTWHKDQRYS
jgi:hypothetical protein